MFYEIRDGDQWEASLTELKLPEVDSEELRESLDFRLSRRPYENPKFEDEDSPITMYFDRYTARGNKAYLVFYRIEGYAVVLEKISRDHSQDF